MAKIQLDMLETYRHQGYLSRDRHQDLDLLIFNYTERTQYDRKWDEYTMICRGLITDFDGNIVGRPFPKIFNLGEPEAPPVPSHESWDVYEKLDGSLLVAANYSGEPVLSTRGRFDSWQARAGRQIIEERYSTLFKKLGEDKTALLELILPEDQKVVDYGGQRDVYLLAVIDNETGAELPECTAASLGLPGVFSYEPIDDPASLPEERENHEGFVLKGKRTGIRYKVKHPSYVEAHRIIFGLTEKVVWRTLRDGKTTADILTHPGVPDEVRNWAEKTEAHFQKGFASIEDQARRVWRGAPKESRKDTALYIQDQDEDLQPILFAFLSNKGYEQLIWKMLEPFGTGEKPDVDEG